MLTQASRGVLTVRLSADTQACLRGQAVFSPDERLVLTGTSADRGGRGGALVFFDAKTHALVRRVAVPGSAVALNWHERLNQIFVGVGARALCP